MHVVCRSPVWSEIIASVFGREVETIQDSEVICSRQISIDFAEHAALSHASLLTAQARLFV